MSEEILAILPGLLEQPGGSILRKLKWCKLIFTTHRLIVAKREKSLLGGSPSFMTRPEYVFTRASTLERMRMNERVSAETFLKEDAESFEIPYSAVTVVDVKQYGKGVPFDFRVFIDDLNVPKYDFDVPLMFRYFDDFMELLRTVLPDKI